MKPNFEKLIKHFKFEGDFLDARPYGFGHINDTYAARFRQSDGSLRRYIIQRINHHVFKKPEEVMSNIERVSSHLRARIVAAGGDPTRESITLIPTVTGKPYCQSAAGDYWRVHLFIEGARTYRVAEKPAHYYHAGKAFGKFLKMLDDFPAEQLYHTIPDFHHTPKRLQSFIQAVDADSQNRAQSVKTEIEFVMQRAEETGVLIDLFEQGDMPQRVAHYDAKLDNVMIDDVTGEGICVIDLDTVMPGLAVFDFGDAVRSGANPVEEDEQDLSGVRLDLATYDRLAQGFLEEAGDVLTLIEVDHLAFAAKLITFEQAIRFLTDHLNGDIYYKIHRQDHNLDRCRTQLELVRDMEAKFEQMVSIIDVYRN